MSITVGGLYQNATFLYGMRLVAGGAGMDEFVSWVHAVEDACAVQGLRGGEVAFTSGLVGAEQCHQLKDATTLKAPKGRHKTGPLFQQIHAQIGARILGDSAN